MYADTAAKFFLASSWLSRKQFKVLVYLQLHILFKPCWLSPLFFAPFFRYVLPSWMLCSPPKKEEEVHAMGESEGNSENVAPADGTLELEGQKESNGERYSGGATLFTANIRERLTAVLSKFLRTHSFHNYSPEAKPGNAQARMVVVLLLFLARLQQFSVKEYSAFPPERIFSFQVLPHLGLVGLPSCREIGFFFFLL